MSDDRTWVLKYEARPWLLNYERAGAGGGHYKRAERVREWREAYAQLVAVERVPPLRFLHAEVLQACRDRRIPDTGSCFPAAKAAIDGLVDAGVLPDDGPEFVRSLTFLRPRTLGYDAMILRICGPVCTPGERNDRRQIEVAALARRTRRRTA